MSILIDHTLLRTKITIPAVKDSLVQRNQLHARITDGLTGRLTAVCAPAGYGKTTLLSQWARLDHHSTAWVSLDERDNDLAKFWQYASHSLAAIWPGDSLGRVLPLAYALPNVSIHTFLDALINELFDLPARIALILDDYQVITDERVHQSLIYLIDHLPSTVHIVIASRTDLPFPTSKWKAREERTDIASADLRLLPDELEALCDKSLGLSLSHRQMDELLDRAEGWVTGIQLALLSLRSQTNYDRYIEQFRGNNRSVSDFLFEEVFSKLPDEMRQFLLSTSVLSRMDAAICDVILQRSDSQIMLDRLQEENLFLVPLDDQNGWFRYHQLFSQFLQNLLKRGNPSEWKEANRRASRCFTEKGMLGEAIDHAIEGQDYAYAEALLEKHIAIMFRQGEFPTLLRWFGSLPHNAGRSPETELLYAFILAITGQAESAEAKLGEVEQRFTAETSGETLKMIRNGILFVKSNLIFFSGQFEKWHVFAEGSAGDMLPENRVFYDFNYNLVEPLVRRTTLGLKGVLSLDTEMVGLRFIQVLESQGWYDSFINLYVKQSLCEGYYEWNRLADSREFLRQIENTINLTPVPGLFVPLRIMQAKLHLSDAKFHLAHETIDQAAEVAAAFPMDQWISYLRAFKIRIWLEEGEVAEAKREIGRLKVSEKDKPTLIREFEYLALVRLLGRQRKFAQALRLLELLKPQSQRESLLPSIMEISVLQALLEYQRGNRAAAWRYLQEAITIGQANGYIRSFVDEGPIMAEILGQYLPEYEQATEAYVRQVISSFPQSERLEAHSQTSTLIEPLTDSELILLNMIREGASNQQIASELAFSIGTVKVYLSRIYAKLGVSSRTQALNKAVELKLL